jgi:hypothetical protein
MLISRGEGSEVERGRKREEKWRIWGASTYCQEVVERRTETGEEGAI